ncbi:hypothetical protein ACOMHN_004829 [Nucella lapillus]
MGFKMAPSESAKVALGVVALAGIDSGTDQKGNTQPLIAPKDTSDKEETLPKLVQNKPQPSDDAETEGSSTSASQTSTAKKNQDESSSDNKTASESASFVSSDMSASISASMAGWEDVKAVSMDTSFLEVKPPLPQSVSAGAAAAGGEMTTSQMGPDSMGSFTEVSHKEGLDEQGGKGDSSAAAEDKSGQSATVPASRTGESVNPAEGEVNLASQKEKATADDVQSLQSEDTSSGEAASFEQINGSDDARSLGDNNAEGGEHLPDFSFGSPQQQAAGGSLQSFEKISMGSSGLKTSTAGDPFPSFEQIKEEGGPGSLKSTDSSIVVIPDSLDGSLQGQQASQGEKEKDSAITPKSEQTQEKEPVIEEIEPQSAQKTESKPAEAVPSESGAGDTQPQPQAQAQTQPQTQAQTQSPQKEPASAEGEGGGSLQSFEVVQGKGLEEVQQYYSSESLQSFATAVSGSGSSKQDFYSPISSPPTFDSSFDDTSFKSFDDTANDTEASEELSFYDVEASGKQSPLSPQDRTPTNTPVPQKIGGGDAQSVMKTFAGETSMEMSDSVVMAGRKEEENESKSDSTKDSEAEDEIEMSESVVMVNTKEGRELKSESTKDSEAKDVPETSPTAKPEGEEKKEESVKSSAAKPEEGEKSAEPARIPMLNIDRDKMTEAILQAQNGPDKLEIGHLQVLVELLKRDDWTLLNTTLQCLLRATAFTINVEVLRVVAGPEELCRLLQRLAPRVAGGGEAKKGAPGLIDGSPGAETLFLNCARVVNNLAMDLKSQPQLEGSIPALTDLLMTEGISETVTLACLQPLTNLASSKTYHGHYTVLLQQLYSFLDTSQSPPLRLQCLKLLVNLSLNADMVPHMLAAKFSISVCSTIFLLCYSMLWYSLVSQCLKLLVNLSLNADMVPHMLAAKCLKLLVNLSLNADMVPHMLAAKAPSCLLDLLDVNYDVELLLRTVTFLANVMAITQERGLSPSNLPTDEKAPSPETLLSALVAHDRRDALRNKVYRLTRHSSSDVCYQASRLYGFVVASK